MPSPLPPALPTEADHAVRAYLRVSDRFLPGGIIACAVTGSIALGAYRPGRSDIDLVAVIADEWRRRQDLISRLRALHLSQVPRLSLRASRGLGVSACCNTAFIWESEVSLPVTEISPIASHTGEIFDSHGAFDVNPVIWKELVDGGITVRGRSVTVWGLDPEPDQLAPWIRANLRGYWSPLAAQLCTTPPRSNRFPGRVLNRRRRLSAGTVEWCVLGPARMHHTLMTGKIVSKEAAGLHLLEAFPSHAPITEVALGRVRSERIPDSPPRGHWRRHTVSAMDDILVNAQTVGKN